MVAIKDARERPWEDAFVVSLVAVWIEKDEPLAQSKKPPKMEEATNVRMDRNSRVGNS